MNTLQLLMPVITVNLQSLEAGVFPTLYRAAIMVTGSLVLLFSVFWRRDFTR